jgi:hypothetical protein
VSEHDAPGAEPEGSSFHHGSTSDEYELANGLAVPLTGDEGDFVEQWANTILGAVVVRAHGTATDWRTLTHQVQEALAAEITHLQTTAPVELRDAVLAYLLRAAVLDTFQSLLDQTYPDWRGELEPVD